jgi:hypothetical protein
VERLTELANGWGAEFGYGISDELTAVAEEWRERMDQSGGVDSGPR